ELDAVLGVDHRLQDGGVGGVEDAVGDHPPYQVLDEGLGHAGVHAVVGHVVAHAVGAPAQRQHGEIARAHHDPAAMVGEAEQVVGDTTGQHVQVGAVVCVTGAAITADVVSPHL